MRVQRYLKFAICLLFLFSCEDGEQAQTIDVYNDVFDTNIENPADISIATINNDLGTLMNGPTATHCPPTDSPTEVTETEGAKITPPLNDQKELYKKRNVSDFTKRCTGIKGPVSFSQMIQKAVEVQIDRPQEALAPGLRGTFGLNHSKRAPVSLISHPMCAFNSSDFKAGKRKNLPSSESQTMIRDFNRMRADFINEKDPEKKKLKRKKLIAFWTFYMGNLAYTESLSAPDKVNKYNNSAKILKKAGVKNKPPGVQFHWDPYQKKAESALNIGLFQFSPKPSGNIDSCIKSWDKAFPKCRLGGTTNTKGMAKILGASDQFFNSFCGVNKIVQTFEVQANTTKNSYTSNSNKGKSYKDRCVSLNKRAYTHFGPLINSTGNNLKKVMTPYKKARDKDPNFLDKFLE